jgi:cellulose synthase/poly-beta-1,6-N-acetylglucosamine synthase-like glycosyltransferase
VISVIIPTFNRASLLRESLESLARQSLPVHNFEVIVVDDGSRDRTSKVCRDLSARLNLKYFRIDNSGISAAKNLGVFAATSPILLFFDDDDIADPDLLREHWRTHREHSDENVAVLGYTGWAPALRVTRLMHFVTEVDCSLFSYPHIEDGQLLDFKYFWGGRSSCKRSFLLRHGVFNQQFRFGSEDIELGYRLSRFGLQMIFNRRAAQYMNRPVTVDEFCRRCEKQGRSLALFARLHAHSPIVQDYCHTADAAKKWEESEPGLERTVRRLRELEDRPQTQSPTSAPDEWNGELKRLYRSTFQAFTVKGILCGMNSELRAKMQ